MSRGFRWFRWFCILIMVANIILGLINLGSGLYFQDLGYLFIGCFCLTAAWMLNHVLRTIVDASSV